MDCKDYQNLMTALCFKQNKPYRQYYEYDKFTQFLKKPDNIENITVSTVKLCIKYKGCFLAH